MKSLSKIILLLLLLFCTKAQSQQSRSDSLLSALKNAANDTVRMVTLKSLTDHYTESDRDSAMYYVENAITVAKKINQPLWVAELLLMKAYLFQKQENLSLSFKLCNEAMIILQDEKNELNAYIPKEDEFAGNPGKYRIALTINVFQELATTYANANNPNKAVEYCREQIRVSESLNSRRGLVNSNALLAGMYATRNLDSSFIFATRALENAHLTGRKKHLGAIMAYFAGTYLLKGNIDSAKHYYWQALSVNRQQNNLAREADVNRSLSQLYRRLLQFDSAKYYAIANLKAANKLKSAFRIGPAADLLSSIWEMQGNADSAFVYLNISKRVGDSLLRLRTDKIAEFQTINFEDQIRLEKEARENIAAKNKIRTIALISGLAFLSILAFVFFRNNRQKQKANKVLETALANLKAAQSQLIQSEKMASLGELTAGIAHEIQNPLNFVNNFSEVNTELVDELKSELATGNMQSAKEIADNIKENQQKINHHGKRADAIVKGMLQHSRTSTGQKEPTDINALADEYLRLAYHGLRAKDKSFNAKFETDFDNSIGKINVVPQDIGRVLLNLINNAFYSVSEKHASKSNASTGSAGHQYQPTVKVSTKKKNGKIEIKVADNGNGIPQSILDKIFQPFFTTKPTGEGTGLGLSLSYDIITKGHGGEIKVENKEGATFIITIPVTY